jgi:hypothetical protein
MVLSAGNFTDKRADEPSIIEPKVLLQPPTDEQDDVSTEELAQKFGMLAVEDQERICNDFLKKHNIKWADEDRDEKNVMNRRISLSLAQFVQLTRRES